MAEPQLPHRPIRSFVRRAGRITTGQAHAIETLGARFILPFRAEPLDLAEAFGRSAPTVFEIGFGMGEATAGIAAAEPQTNFLCCDVHAPGVGALLRRIGELGLSNVRIVQHDAIEVIASMLPAWQPGMGHWDALAGVHIFFPDPWHKKRHNKRRLIQPPLVHDLAQRLAPGGHLHCATDWEPYAQQMLEVLEGEPMLANTTGGFAARPSRRPLTKFEQRGTSLGHAVRDLLFVRRAPEGTDEPMNEAA